MLITPVQPHNSLNNIPIQIHERSGESQQDSNGKIQEIKSAGKKSTTNRARKAHARKSEVSIAVAKRRLLMELRLQESVRRNATKNMNDMEVHKEELIQRKQLLAEILKEYEQISKDKNILTAEIKNMKKYLSEIRSKLDQSMSILNRNTTLIAMKGGIADNLFKSKTKKLPTKKRKSKAEKTPEKPKSLLAVNDSFLTKESLINNTVSALKLK